MHLYYISPFPVSHFFFHVEMSLQDHAQQLGAGSLFVTIRHMMEQLTKHRQTLVSDTLSKDHIKDLKHEVVTYIDWGNG